MARRGRPRRDSFNASSGATVEFPEKLQCLFDDNWRYLAAHGGRNSTKSWSIVRSLVLRTRSSKLLVLCARELQNSIADSVHSLIDKQIHLLGLQREFEILKKEIIHKASESKFIFKGIRHNVEEIKSTEGVDVCWVEEAAKLTQRSIDILFPTIRKPGSQIILSWNDDEETDPIQEMFVNHEPPPRSIVIHMTYRDNPWFDEDSDIQRQWMKRKDPDAYDWIWEGHPRKISELAVYRDVIVDAFESPSLEYENGERQRFYYGLDWGFGTDPTAGLRMFIKDNDLYIDRELYEFKAELDDLPEKIRYQLPGINEFGSYGDDSRPETIKYLNRNGVVVYPATRKKGSIEDGIAFIKAFNRIIVHPRCENTIMEFKLYKYKQKKVISAEKDELVFTQPEDRHNHLMDAMRYGFNEEINGTIPVQISEDHLKAYAALAPSKNILNGRRNPRGASRGLLVPARYRRY